MKKFEIAFTCLKPPLDYLMVALAGFTAYSLRFADYVKTIRPVAFSHTLTWDRYWPLVLWVGLGWLVIFTFAGLYNTDPNRKLARDLTRVIFACSMGFATITIYVFSTLQKFDSRFLVLAGWILATVYVSAGRIFIHLLKYFLHQAGVGLRRTVIIGHETIANQIKDALKAQPELGYKIVGAFDHFTNDAPDRILKLQPDEIIYTDPKTHEDQTLQTVEFANEYHITFKYSADLFATISSNMAVSTIAGIPIVELGKTSLIGWGRILKRLFDIVMGSALFIISLPAAIFIALGILLESGRPIFYKNERIGQKGQKFIAYKFRSMRQKDCTGEQFGEQGVKALEKEKDLIQTNSIKEGPIYKIQNDPRITPFGKLIRRWSLDELPQFINVIMGDMSLVGPRPHQPREVEGYQKQHKIIYTIKPGISGLAQISGRSNLSYEEEIKLDTFYMEHWSLIMDLIILIKTPFVVLLRKGAL
ncbi:MAG: hypothetical protein UX39_C0001G0035 [Candidatus Magasanikbacteria bacterium GW2011_GWA2_46_17]|uniref:Bacterial sugar transferase domain-containing protein n=1 Tax=Candidatus Magasanikbacteria bacterium GW2011_GWA2_46_17 TaxID=1619042 RepID=A0A0G1S282_9BACT|nr:MAG: hypothetical protein UX39_C0001G0035 [Candidatus Magasanikbacteria bacterium GW2011_GWA2_46_17]